jgi:transmembrane protein 18
MEQLDQIYADVRNAALGMQQGSAQFWNITMDYFHSIDWSERWIQALVGGEAALLLVTLVWRRKTSVQMSIFALCAAVMMLAEPLNKMGADYWEDFATQPYFDKRGGFMAGVVLVPLLLIMITCLVNYLVQVISEMVALKRRQLAKQGRQKAAAHKKGQ